MKFKSCFFQKNIGIYLQVETPDEICFFLADKKTNKTLKKIQDHLINVVDPKAAGCKVS